MDIKGFAVFKIVTDDVPQTVNLLKGGDFAVHDIRVTKGAEVTGEVHWYDVNKLKSLMADRPVQLEITSRRGLVYMLMKYRRRLGIFIGVFLAAAVVFICSNTVLRIEVNGNETMSDSEVISVLNDYGISVGKYIPSLDIRKIERQIITAFDKFRWIGIRSSGCRIIVEVSEITDSPEMVATSVPCNIIAARDAQIVDVRNVYMGMLIPMLGDGVKKGELLISGTVDGKLDHDYYVHAMGEVIGRYTDEVTFTQPLCDTVRSYGDSFTRRSLYILGLRIPLYLNDKDDFPCDLDERLEYVNFLGLTLPVGTVFSEYMPYTEQEITYTPEEAEALLDEAVARYEKNFLDGEDIVIIDVQREFHRREDSVEAVVTYILEG
ncbi:MAG: sporulation protein YqfD, partial [Oscillospiraceae bacterium]